MGDTTIEWTDKVWNPVRGCSRVSVGCEHCYAERQAHRFSGKGQPYENLTRLTSHGPVWTGKIRLVPEALDQPLHWKKPRRIFVNSMSDLFHEDVPFNFVDQVFDVMRAAEHHTFQILTKRPERMREYALQIDLSKWKWIHLGVSVEDQPTADERIPILLQTPAAVRFVSAEPLLSAIDIRVAAFNGADSFSSLEGLNWVIVGGESGPNARPFDFRWARSVVAQCKAAGVPCFVKQMGSVWAKALKKRLMEPDQVNRQWAEMMDVWDSAATNPELWPEDLRVRQFPA